MIASKLSLSQLDFERAADNPPPPLIDGHLDCGTTAFCHGLASAGKSWQCYTMGLAVAGGRKYLGRYAVKQGPVVIWVEEGARHKISSRIARLRRGLGISDAEASKLPIRYIILQGLKLDRTDHVGKLRHDLSQHDPPSLFVVDNLTRVHNRDENKPSDMGRVLEPLTDIQRTYDCTVLLIHHDRKNGIDAGASTNLRGSGDFDAWWRNRVHVEQPNQDGVIKATPSSKDGLTTYAYNLHVEDLADGSAALVWDGPAINPKHAETDAVVIAVVKKLGIQATVNNIAAETKKGKGTVIASLKRQVDYGLLRTETAFTTGGQPAIRYRVLSGPEAA